MFLKMVYWFKDGCIYLFLSLENVMNASIVYSVLWEITIYRIQCMNILIVTACRQTRMRWISMQLNFYYKQNLR